MAGRYELSVYAPYCLTRRDDTDGARYEINHAAGRSTVTVEQGNRLGLWTSLGEYPLTAGTGNMLRLTDLTTTDSGKGVWFDAIRVRYIKPGRCSGPCPHRLDPSGSPELSAPESLASRGCRSPQMRHFRTSPRRATTRRRQERHTRCHIGWPALLACPARQHTRRHGQFPARNLRSWSIRAADIFCLNVYPSPTATIASSGRARMTRQASRVTISIIVYPVRRREPLADG